MARRCKQLGVACIIHTPGELDKTLIIPVHADVQKTHISAAETCGCHACFRCWCILIVQFLVRDRYFSQYLHEVLARLEGFGSTYWQDSCLPEEALLQSLLALCVQLMSGGPGPAVLDDFVCELGKLTLALLQVACISAGWRVWVS